MKKIGIIAMSAVLLTSCVSKKKVQEVERLRDNLRIAYDKSKSEVDECERKLAISKGEWNGVLQAKNSELDNEKKRAKALDDQIEHLKKTNNNLLDRLSDLSIVSKAGAESISKSLEAINQQNKYIQTLNTSAQRKDSVNLALVMNLKRSLSDVKDEDVTIEVKKGVVYVSLSDKMLFDLGSSAVQAQAEVVLGKIAKILNDYKELDILVEGHTDNVAYTGEAGIDNWDLSVKRATSVVRLLQKKYNVSPERMTAGGRSEYMPKIDNATPASRSLNRRTEIVILPKLDQFFQLSVPQSQK
jgi:chemotaxis protein MotB